MPAVIAPSRMPRGSWVGTKAMAIFVRSGIRGSLPFKADARMNDVARYVSQSAATPAAKAGNRQAGPAGAHEPEYEKPRERPDDAHGDDVRAERGEAPVGEEERLYQQGDRGDKHAYRGAEQYGGDGRAAGVASRSRRSGPARGCRR